MDAYLEILRHGKFKGVLRWEQLDSLWEAVRREEARGWYAYTVGTPPPAEPAAAAESDAFMVRVEAALRHGHARDYCGLVYADDREAPSFIVVHHPQKVIGCGGGDGPAPPGWTLSTLPPVDISPAAARAARPL